MKNHIGFVLSKIWLGAEKLYCFLELWMEIDSWIDNFSFQLEQSTALKKKYFQMNMLFNLVHVNHYLYKKQLHRVAVCYLYNNIYSTVLTKQINPTILGLQLYQLYMGGGRIPAPPSPLPKMVLIGWFREKSTIGWSKSKVPKVRHSCTHEYAFICSFIGEI